MFSDNIQDFIRQIRQKPASHAFLSDLSEVLGVGNGLFFASEHSRIDDISRAARSAARFLPGLYGPNKLPLCQQDKRRLNVLCGKYLPTAAVRPLAVAEGELGFACVGIDGLRALHPPNDALGKR